MMSRRTLGIAAASIAATGLVGAGLIAGAGTAFADPTATPTPGASGKPSGAAKPRTPGAAPSGAATPGARPAGKGAGQAPHQHTEVTGAEADKVIAAVKVKDPAVEVTKVLKDADGSYDVVGTKAGAKMRYEVSADLATVTEGKPRPEGRGPKGGGAGQHTDVTGAEADKVIAAVKTKDAAIEVTKVQKDADGSYDAIGTKAGAKVKVDVSADLQTVTVKTPR
jgi:hypothetical protein